MKTKKVMPLLLSAIMTFGAVTAVPITANAQTSAVSVQTAQASLATPKISKAESVYGGVKLTWSKVKGAEKYRVYYKGSKGWTRLADTTSTSYTDSKVSSGKTYTYTVRCISKDSKKFTSGYNSKGTKATFIAAPKISKAENINGGVKITWNKSNGAEKYRVYYKGSKGWTKLADTTSTSFTDSKVSSGKTYTYTVRCISKDSKKFTSGYNSSGTKATFIATPKITKAESINGGVKISWGKSNGAEKYRVYYKGSKGWTRLADTTSTSFTDSKVYSGKTYTYTVRCLNSSADKFTSGYDANGTKATYIAAPEITKTDVTYNSVTLTWNESNGAEKYRVYRKGENGWTKLFDTTSTTFTDTNLYADTEYTYTVRCINSSANRFTSGYNSTGYTVTTSEAPSEHTHTWEDITGETQVKVVDEEAYTYEEPIYEKHDRTICNDCGADITDNVEHIFDEIAKGGKGSYSNKRVKVQVGTKTVTVPEKFHYETKIVVIGRKCTTCGKVEMFSEEHTHTWEDITEETQVKVVDEEATVKQMQAVVCSEPTCQKDLSGYTSEQISEHMKQHALNGENAGWHTSTKTVEVPEKFHYETKIVVVGRKCTECGEVEMFSEEHTHTWEDVTEDVTYTETVIETVYEEKVRTICNDCGADITGNTKHIFDEIKSNSNAKGSYHAEIVLVPVEKTKIVTKTKTVVIGRKCTECGEIEYY